MRSFRFHTTLAHLGALAALAVPAFAVEALKPTAPQLEFFEKKIRPVLVASCYKCHSSESEKVKGGLLLDTREGLLKGGDSGPSVVPGDPNVASIVSQEDAGPGGLVQRVTVRASRPIKGANALAQQFVRVKVQSAN